MLKINLLKEIRQQELVQIEDIISGNQFEDVFGGKLRIIIPVNSKFTSPDMISKGYEEDDKAKDFSSEYLKVFEEIVNRCSTKDASYEIDYPNAAIKKHYSHKNPKDQKNYKKTKTVSISKFISIIQAAINDDEGKFKEIRKFFDEISTEMIPVLSSAMMFKLYFITFANEKLKTKQGYYGTALANDSEAPFQYFEETLVKWVEFSGNYSMVVSRAPVDLLRMSDFPAKGPGGEADYTKGIVSCHSPKRLVKKIDDADGSEYFENIGGEYFDCAVQESRGNGAIAFLVSNKSLSGLEDKLDSRDFFRDLERNLEGPTPIQRIRLRRYLNLKTVKEILVPESAVYPAEYASVMFKMELDKWARNAQQGVISEIKSVKDTNILDYILIGGSYSDNHSIDLLQSFLGFQIHEPGEATVNKKISERSYKSEFFVNELLNLAGFGANESFEISSLIKSSLQKHNAGITASLEINNILIDMPDLEKINNSTGYNDLVRYVLRNEIEHHGILGTRIIPTCMFADSQLKISLKIIYDLNRSKKDEKKLIAVASLLEFLFKKSDGSAIDTISVSKFTEKLKKEILKLKKEKFAGKPPGVEVRKKPQLQERKNFKVNILRG